MNIRRLLTVSIAALLLISGGSAHGSTVDHSLFTAVLKKHVSEGMVDYRGLKEDERFDRYLETLRTSTPDAIPSTADRLAFWINTYNAFTLKLIIDHYPVKSIKDIKRNGTGPWDIVWIEIGGQRYSLNQIEHDIIRKEFDEPRIHMALVCAAVGCPPLRSEAYEGSRLEEQLQDNTKKFFSDTKKNRYELQTRTLYLSELLDWYGDDFVARYGSARNFALKVMGLTSINPATIKYLPYDWSLNEQR